MAIPAVAALPAIAEMVTGAVALIVGIWTVKNAPKISLPKSSPMSSAADDVEHTISNAVDKAIDHAKNNCSKCHCPPPPIGTVCFFIHMNNRHTHGKSSLCLNPAGMHIHTYVRNVYMQGGTCKCDWDKLDGICIAPGDIKSVALALTTKFLTSVNPFCAGLNKDIR